MHLCLTLVGVSGFTLLAVICLTGARRLPFGILSLPSIMALTSIIYFYWMPVIALRTHKNTLYGSELTTLEPTHMAVLLYAIGAALAFRSFSADFRSDPSSLREQDSPLSPVVLSYLFALAIIGMIIQVTLGHFNLFYQSDFVIDVSSPHNFGFLSLSYSLMIPLTVVIMIRTDFSISSWLLFGAVLFVFLTVGFRFRLVIIICATVSSFCLVREIKLGFFRTTLGVIFMLSLVNLIGMSRNYYGGLDFSSMADANLFDLVFGSGGEIGLVFTLSHIASSRLDNLIFFDPWIIGFSRLIPSFLYDKPFPQYLFLYSAGFPDPRAVSSGVAAPQQAEFLLQFGWFGLPVLSCFYFCIASYTVRRLQHLSREARITGCAIVPSLFGFYMQQRGYFFQFLCEYLFMIVPLFLLHYATTHAKSHSQLQLGAQRANRTVGP